MGSSSGMQATLVFQYFGRRVGYSRQQVIIFTPTAKQCLEKYSTFYDVYQNIDNSGSFTLTTN
jgi:hypothetical protein